MRSPDCNELSDLRVGKTDLLKVTPGCQPTHTVPDQNDLGLRIGRKHCRDKGIQLLALLVKGQGLVVRELYSIEVPRTDSCDKTSRHFTGFSIVTTSRKMTNHSLLW